MALSEASRIAQKFHSRQVGTEHLVFGLATIKDSASAKILAENGITPKSLQILFDNNGDFFRIFAQKVLPVSILYFAIYHR